MSHLPPVYYLTYFLREQRHVYLAEDALVLGTLAIPAKVCVCIHTHAHTYIHTHTHTHTHIYTYIYIYMYIYIHTYIHTYIYIYIYIRIYIHT